MSKTWGYLRVSTNLQDEENQRHEIASRYQVDEFIAIKCSSRKSQAKRGLIEMFSRIQPGDVLIVSELSRLGRSISEVVKLVEDMIKGHIGLIALKNGISIPPNGAKMDMTTKIQVTMFSMMAEIERDMVSIRTTEAMAARRAAGQRMGKPVGTIQPSRLDGHLVEIAAGLEAGHSIRAIAGAIGCGRTTLIHYIRTRGIK